MGLLKTKLLNADYSKVDIIELCYIQNKCLENEQFEILAKIHEEAKNRILTDYEINLLDEHLNSKNSEFKYMNELNGLIENLKKMSIGNLENIKQIMGIKFKKLRLDNGFSQEDAGKYLGLNRTSITNIECGNQSLTPESIYRASIIFKCNANDFFPEKIDEELEFVPTRELQRIVKVNKLKDKLRELGENF